MCIRDRSKSRRPRHRRHPEEPGQERALLDRGAHRDDRGGVPRLSLIHISEPTRLLSISYAVFCLKKKKKLYNIKKKKYIIFFFFNDTATTEIYTRSLVGSVRCV